MTESEWMKMKKDIYRNHKPVDWDDLGKEITHAVFFSELRSEDGVLQQVETYPDRSFKPCTEKDFKQYQKSGRYTFAIHRR